MSSLPPLIGERYKPLRLLGRGGGGVVYEVEHVHTGSRLALKVLTSFENASPETVARFRREARLAAAIESEHIVRITDAGTASELFDTPFLVMELMQGHTLEREAKEPIPPREVVELLTQVARALERAHAQGIIHRDLKPENLFVTRREDGSPLVKVLDFGIAKRTGEGTTEQGTVLGTPEYMSPEQAQGHGARVDARTDTWALGLVAFRLLFGRSYFEADSTLRLLHRVAFEQIVPPSELGCRASPEFDAWFMRSCSRDLAMRFTSAAQQIRELGQALANVEVVEVELRPTLELGPANRSPDTHDPLFARAGSLTQPASTPQAGHHSAPRGPTSGSATSPLTTSGKRRYFAVGAGLSAVLLVGLVLVLRAVAPPPAEQAVAPAAKPSRASEPMQTEPPKTQPPVAAAPTVRSARDDAEQGAAPAAASDAAVTAAPRPRGAEPPRPLKPRARDASVRAPEPEYDPLGDQR